MKIAIMGTGPFAVPSCQRLLEQGHSIGLVVVRPPASSSAKKGPPTPVQSWAEKAALPIFHPASINADDALDRLRAEQVDLFFVCDYGQILSRDCLSIPRLGGINLHGSLLPRHRGAAPVQWTLLSGDARAGVSVIHMTPGFDAGPIISTRAVDVGRDENAEELERRLSALGCDATTEAVNRLSSWDGTSQIGVIQDKTLATKAPRLTRADGQIDFSQSAIEIVRRVRGYQPWPGAYGNLVYSETKQLAVHVRAARAVATRDASHRTGSEAHPPHATGSEAHPTSLRRIGAVWATTAAELELSGDDWLSPWDKLLAVQTGDEWLLVSCVQPAGKRPMPTGDFLRGHPLTPEARFALTD